METKTCKYCKSEIDKKAKICPNCRKKQKGGILGKVLIAVIVLAILGAALGSGGGDDKKSSDTAAKTETSAKKSDEKVTDAEETEEPETEAKGYIEEGETFEAKGLKISVNEIDQNYEPKDNEYGFYDLDDGLKYVAASFTFENVDDSDKYVSIYDFDCYADNSACEQKYLPEDDFINGNISSGRNVSFTTYYAVPEDADSIELEYEADFWTSEKVIVKIK